MADRADLLQGTLDLLSLKSLALGPLHGWGVSKRLRQLSQDVLEVCERDGLGFFPWFPLAAGELAKPGGPVAEIAQAHDATPGHVALAWLLQRSPVMLPIPGTGSIGHLEENVAAAELELNEEELARLEDAA